MSDCADAAVVFSAVLRPHRSAGPSAVRLLVVLVAAVWAAVGLVFVIAGAWPVVPFFGIEVLLLWLALRLNDRAGRAYEAINLTEKALTVRRVDHWGKMADFSFPPQWLQVNMAEPASRRTPLELRSHGRSLVIGSFLLPEERRTLARTLRRELGRLTRTTTVAQAPYVPSPRTSRME